METTLVTTGLISLLAAIVGGGLKGLGFEIPALQSTRRQLLLGLFGFFLVTASQFGRITEYLTKPTPGSGYPIPSAGPSPVPTQAPPETKLETELAPITEAPPAELISEIDKSPSDQKHPSVVEAKVPNLIGLNRDQAAHALKSEGLALGNITTHNTGEWVVGKVMAQQPEGGKVISRGSSVSLVLAQVPPPPKPPPEPPLMIKIPNTVGMSVRAARTDIEALGLQVVRRERNVTDSTKIGVVIEQHPMAGMSLKKGATVELVISTESPVQKATVPNIIGLSMQEALDALQNAGLQLGRRDPQRSSRPPGTILRQSIAAGEKVARSSEVNLIYASWPRVPNMIGLSMQEALDTLQNAGLQLGRRDPQRSSRPPGAILRQSIAPRTEVAPGSTVSLVYASQVARRRERSGR